MVNILFRARMAVSAGFRAGVTVFARPQGVVIVDVEDMVDVYRLANKAYEDIEAAHEEFHRALSVGNIPTAIEAQHRTMAMCVVHERARREFDKDMYTFISKCAAVQDALDRAQATAENVVVCGHRTLGVGVMERREGETEH